MGNLRSWQGEKPGENGTLVIFIREDKKRAGFLVHRGSGESLPLWGGASNVLDCDTVYIWPGLSLSEIGERFPGWSLTETTR